MNRKILLLTIAVIYSAVTTLFVSSCKKEDPEPPKPVAASVQLVTGGAQAAFAGDPLANPVEVLVKDQDGVAFAGAKVTFAVAEGSVSATTANTNAQGKASLTWTLGSTVGSQTLIVTAYKADGSTPLSGSPLNVTATANEIILEATSIEFSGGDGQSAYINMPLPSLVSVVVKDQFGNAFQGATVNFSVTEGSVSSATVITGASGFASVNWTLGPTAGTQTLTAKAFKADGTTELSGSPVTVTATANIKEAAIIELSSGGDQQAIVGNELANSILIIVKDEEGNPFEGETVNFTVTEGSLSVPSAITNTNGFASVNWTLGQTEGTQTLTVTAFKSDGTTALTGSPLVVTATGVKPAGSDPVTDYDGNVYQTVIIGSQVWMAEDLKVTHYSDGAALTLIDNAVDWNALPDRSLPTFAYDNFDPSSGHVQYSWGGAARSQFGGNNKQGACPTGWHLPSSAEVSEMLDALGSNSVAGGKMKETGTTHWLDPNTGATNSSGFTALPSALLSREGTFISTGTNAGYWTATTPFNVKATQFILYHNKENVLVMDIDYFYEYGRSVRCVKD